MMIGKAESTSDVKAVHDQNPWKIRFQGVSTTFQVQRILKGREHFKEKGKKKLQVLHFRLQQEQLLENGPLLISFRTKPLKLNLNANGSRMNVLIPAPEYMLFLKRNSHGNWEPVSGRIDPQLSIREIHQHHHWMEHLQGE